MRAPCSRQGAAAVGRAKPSGPVCDVPPSGIKPSRVTGFPRSFEYSGELYSVGLDVKAQRVTGYLLIAILTAAGWGRSASGWFWNTGTPATPHPAVVRVIALDTRGASLGTGTLVAVNEYHGLVVTNWHVVRDARGSILVQFPDGFASPATVLKVDREWDLAALAVWRPRAKPVPIAVDPPRPGDVLMIAGYGQGDYRVSYGPCTQYLSPSPGLPAELVELRATARQGDSGGPIFNARGELAGVLFGSGFTETMGAYCGRVRSFLFPLKETFDKLPPPDPLLLAANAVGPPGRSPANSTATPQGKSLIPTQPVSPVGSPPVTLPLTASDNTTGRVAGDPSNATSTILPSQDSWPGSSGTGEYAASDVNAWRPAEPLSDSQHGADLAASAYSSGRVPNDTGSSGFDSSGAGPSSVPGYSTGYSGDTQTNSGLGNEYARAQTEKDGFSDSSDYYGLSDSRHFDGVSTDSPSGYDRGLTDNHAGNARDFYAKDDSGARSAGKFDRVGDTATEKGTSRRGEETGRRPYEAWDYWSSKPYESSEDSYGQGQSLASWTGSSEKSSSAGGHRTTQNSREDRPRHGTATASINTRSGGTTSSGKSEDIPTGKNAWNSYPTGHPTDGHREDSGEDLSHTIESREDSGKYSGSNSDWDYSPIPVYDAEPGAGESPSSPGWSFGNGEESSRGSAGKSTSERRSEDGGSRSWSSSQSSDRDKNMRGEESSSTKKPSSSGRSTYRNREGYGEGNGEYFSKGADWSGTYSTSQGDSSWNSTEKSGKTPASTGGSTESRNSHLQSASPGERNFDTLPEGQKDTESDRTREWTSNTRSSDAGGATSPRSSDSVGTGYEANTAQNGGSVSDPPSPAGQPRSATNKINVGWETMIGIFGLLVLFVQSMRWLSLLYDRSYYRRRSYRTTRRRTTWPPPPPAGYRWYY